MQKRLYRSTKDRMLAGVCGGLAEYFDIDPVIIRVLFVVVTLGAGVGILGYIILWIVVPEAIIVIRDSSNPNTENESQAAENTSGGSGKYANFERVPEEKYAKKCHSGRVFISVLLILIGVLWFINNIVPGVNFGHLWPLILVALGILILLKSSKTC
ncbi:MAG: PspC domain-containing protein [bacterium]